MSDPAQFMHHMSAPGRGGALPRGLGVVTLEIRQAMTKLCELHSPHGHVVLVDEEPALVPCEGAHGEQELRAAGGRRHWHCAALASGGPPKATSEASFRY